MRQPRPNPTYVRAIALNINPHAQNKLLTPTQRSRTARSSHHSALHTKLMTKVTSKLMTTLASKLTSKRTPKLCIALSVVGCALSLNGCLPDFDFDHKNVATSSTPSLAETDRKSVV